MSNYPPRRPISRFESVPENCYRRYDFVQSPVVADSDVTRPGTSATRTTRFKPGFYRKPESSMTHTTELRQQQDLKNSRSVASAELRRQRIDEKFCKPAHGFNPITGQDTGTPKLYAPVRTFHSELAAKKQAEQQHEDRIREGNTHRRGLLSRHGFSAEANAQRATAADSLRHGYDGYVLPVRAATPSSVV
eukprot:TRINITY_DN15892_c0_g1_i1.p1 TRINITY_DN15892_c0_g1~~TRINITY_DN15892_c0_g1_i1.p1  ORF type:complete len:204 (+),score=7.51 TRINITY_DN15892_c0_g1_i1:41-613(+)